MPGRGSGRAGKGSGRAEAVISEVRSDAVDRLLGSGVGRRGIRAAIPVVPRPEG